MKLHGQEASSLVDYATPVRLGAFFFGLLIILATYMMLSPKSGLDTVRRIMAPWSNVAAPSRSRILSVSPGDAQVTLGTQLTIRAEVRGIMASEGVQVVYETTDGSLVDQLSIWMQKPLAYPMCFRLGGRPKASNNRCVIEFEPVMRSRSVLDSSPVRSVGRGRQD